MRTRHRKCSVATLAAGALLAGCGSGETSAEEITLRYTEPANSREFRPIDQDAFRISLPLHHGSKNAVGKIVGVCLGDRDDGACKARAILPDGRLSFGIVVRPEGDDIGTITGGTGRYLGAGGSFLSEPGKDGSSKHTFHVRLP